MAKKPLPSPELLRQLLKCEPEKGLLTWRHRSPDMFPVGNTSREGNAKRWNSRYAGKPAFAHKGVHGYLTGKVFAIEITAHRVVWAVAHGDWASNIDHINGDKTDNRIANLRSVTHAENHKNRPINRNNTSGVCGVSWRKVEKKWRADIKVDGQAIYLGLFDDFADAVSVRIASEIEHGFHKNHGRQAA